MVHKIGGKVPEVDKALFVAWNAEVAGSVTLAAETSIWFSATLRGDIEYIKVGRGSNVQDGATLHTDFGLPCVVGEGVTIGHRAILHGCTVGDDCLIGMGAVVLSGAVIGRESIVGAAALVTEGMSFPPRSLIIGIPAKAVRTLDDEAIRKVRENGRVYVRLAAEAGRAYAELPG
ncbi:MAG: gamma carbonic anhydrase family protein [Spirochaetia bacterium]|jgi:carbonic anhydrase/acetyltransferase-like protein (isoleucine patch superfamily)